ncbi:MAG TPA: hypothetical protein VFZ89_18180 [Solirubrobacteraceae bacterium]
MRGRGHRRLLVGLAILATPASAPAYWSGGGAGSGSTAVATMPAGAQPAGSAAAQSVTVSWPQSTFLVSRLGTYDGGGYAIRRYAEGSTTAVPACTSTGGAAAVLQCTEPGVPYGRWQFTVTPVLHSLTGAESAKSAVVTVAPGAPVLDEVVAQSPTSTQTTGDIALDWQPVPGATGYNVYRRTAGGAYGAPLNGATPLSATAYTDAGGGLTATSYEYVVRAVAAAVESASSNAISATATAARPAVLT